MKKKSLLLGTALLLSLNLVFAGCSKATSTSLWKDGTYSGKGEGVHGDIQLDVVIKGGKIDKINITSQDETSGVGEVAVEKVPVKIIEKQSPDVEAVAGATVSSKAIMEAVKQALEKAK